MITIHVRFPVERMRRIAIKVRAGKPFTIQALAKEFEVSYKTIWRDIEFMRDRLGYEINYCHSRRTWLGMAPTPLL